jgi:hypothetical protein
MPLDASHHAYSDVQDEEHQAAEASALSVDSRCEVDPGAKRGTIKCAVVCFPQPATIHMSR